MSAGGLESLFRMWDHLMLFVHSCGLLQLWAFATVRQQEKSCCMRAHSRTHAHTQTHDAVQPSPILVDLKGQRPTAGRTVFQRTVLGEFLKSLLLDFSKKSVGGGWRAF